VTSPQTNERVILLERPTGAFSDDCLTVESEPLAALEADQVRIAVGYVSVDAFIRTALRDTGFHQTVPIGGTVGALGAGHIIESNVEGWDIGQAVRGGLGAQSVASVGVAGLEKIDESVAPLDAYLGALGLTTGLTAWVGVREVGKPGPGDVFVVTAAAGAVGSIAGQVAKHDGATVIGIAGGPDKAAHIVDQLGFDAGIDYKNEDVAERLRELAPEGVNVFFDNVGGDLLDIVLDQLAMRARVVICGAISQYERTGDVAGPSMYLRLAERQSRMEGFAVFHFPESLATAGAELAGWLADGSLTMPQQILEGIDRFPEALQMMFTGANLGKLLVKIR
jgi:NADPH-dependent curcumin reductase CurA